MRIQGRVFFLLTAFLFITTTHSYVDITALSSSAPVPSPAPSPVLIPFPDTNIVIPTEDDVNFIRTSCASTEYPQECFSSLSQYASVIQQYPGRLVRTAIFSSLSRAKLEATYFSTLSKNAGYEANLSKKDGYGDNHRATNALHDCHSLFSSAVDQLLGSLNQIRHLDAKSSESFLFQMSNVQTWMSAALTNEETCKDGFNGVADGATKTELFNRVKGLEAETSNALALVNSYVDMVSTDSVSFP